MNFISIKNMKYKFGKFSIFGPTKPLFVLIFVVEIPPQKDWHLRAFSKLFWRRVESWYFWTIIFWKSPPKKISLSKRFQRIFRWWILGILGQSYFWNYCDISKSYWIKNIFQMVTYYLSKKVRPRTFLVFMENHPFENFSPHTFLVFM